MSNSQSITVSFQSLSTGLSYKMELDNEYFETVNGVSKTSYNIDDEIFLKIFPREAVENYSLSSSSGNLTVETKNILYTVEEQIVFAHKKEGSLSYVPEGTPSYSWLGEDGGVPIFSEMNITLSEEKTAVLKVSYTTKGDRLKLSGISNLGEDFSVVCAALYSSGNTASQTLSISDDSDPAESLITDVTLTIKDVITGNPIPYANVYLEGIDTQISDENGQVTFSNLQKGQTYSVITQAAGYQYSNMDHLNNDSFTIPLD